MKDLREALARVEDVKLVSVDFDIAEITVEFVGVKAFPAEMRLRDTGCKPAADSRG